MIPLEDSINRCRFQRGPSIGRGGNYGCDGGTALCEKRRRIAVAVRDRAKFRRIVGKKPPG